MIAILWKPKRAVVKAAQFVVLGSVDKGLPLAGMLPG